MKYKTLILDLDGTTVPSTEHGKPSQKVINAIKEAKKHLVVAIATGRPLSYCRDVLTAINIDGICVFDGGSQIIEVKTNKLLYEKPLSIDQQKSIVEILLRFGCNVWRSPLFDPEDRITNPEQITSISTKVFVDTVSNNEVLPILEELEAVKEISPHPTSSWSKGDVVDLHITHEKGNKKHGVEELLKILNVKKEETIGVGDSHNDLPLLSSVGFKVAMGQAPDELKKMADYVTLTLDEDGVADVIEKFILNS